MCTLGEADAARYGVGMGLSRVREPAQTCEFGRSPGPRRQERKLCRAVALALCVQLASAPAWLSAQVGAADAGATTGSGSDPADRFRMGNPDGREAPQEALDHYLRGRRWYLAGRYRDALTELKAALELDRDSPDLLYNVARVYENLGELESALEYYQRYLTKLPEAAEEERDKTQKTIRRLQGAKRELAARPPPPAAGTDAQSHVGRADLAFWLTSGAAIALFGGGGAMGVFALQKKAKVEAYVAGPDGTLAERERLGKEAKRFGLFADGLFIAGGVALTSAALLFLLRDSDEEPAKGELQVGLAADRQHALLDVSGSF
jgi:tetratricopeptide (TPR) repeat protein